MTEHTPLTEAELAEIETSLHEDRCDVDAWYCVAGSLVTDVRRLRAENERLRESLRPLAGYQPARTEHDAYTCDFCFSTTADGEPASAFVHEPNCDVLWARTALLPSVATCPHCGKDFAWREQSDVCPHDLLPMGAKG